jgi:glucose-6-phosphate isomerase
MARPRTLTSSPIELDLAAALDHDRGVGRSDLLLLAPRLEAARERLIETAAGDFSHWLNWPRRLLEDHQAQRHRGLLTRWLTAAKEFRETVDRAVILGSPASIAVLEAIFAACCHPHHNELPRGERGGRPRIYFVSTGAGNDAIQGVLDLLPQGRRLELDDESWGIVALDDGEESELLTAICKVFWDALLGTTTPGEEAERAMMIGADQSPLVAFAEQADLPRLPHFSPLPLAGEGPGVRGEVQASDPSPSPRSSPVKGEGANQISGGEDPFYPGVLLAAAVMNIDVVQYLFGAVTMTDRFRAGPVGGNLPLDFAGCAHLLADRCGIRGWSIDCPAELKPLARWWQGGDPICETDPQQLLIQWLTTSVRRDRLRVTMPAGEAPSGRKKTLERYLPDVSSAAAEAIRNDRVKNGLPTAVVRLPTVDESTVGQLLQMRMIADQCTLHAPS